MTAQDLKNAILQLAVQGKLVPQDPDDEPVSELLKCIKAEKKQLILEGKLIKEKQLSPITDDEIPFDIPESWEWVKLGDLCVISTGKKMPTLALLMVIITFLRVQKNQSDAIHFRLVANQYLWLETVI